MTQQCSMCGETKSVRAFPPGSPICRLCIDNMVGEDDEIDYAEAEPVSKLRSHIELIAAIRDQAERDGEVEDFEAYWTKSPEWSRIWYLMGKKS